MKNVFYIVTVIFLTVIGLTVNAKPRCQGFNNYDNKVTIVSRTIKPKTNTRFLM